MKIIAIGRNYAEHAKELNNPLPTEPVVFLKPSTSIINGNKPFYYPDFSNDIHHEVELVLKISRAGRHVDEKFANRYYNQIGIGIDFTARDLQKAAKEKGLPWEKAKAFDGSAPVGDFIDKDQLPDINNIIFSLKINGEIAQEGNSADMIFSFDQIVSYVSRFFSLQIGDLIFTGTPSGVGPVKIGDELEAFIGDDSLLKFSVK
jgi:2-keto-4-pentenoate hydratase/2-oxohepta-3-ene-1,7-dioic acid hydratase in catechol pathway